MIQHTEQNNCTFMQWWIFFITVHGGNLAVLNTHICINPPPCMLICSIYCKLHYPCSQHGCLFTVIIEFFDISAALSDDHLWILWTSSQKQEISIFLYFTSYASVFSIFTNSYTFKPSFLFFSQHLHYHPLSLSPHSLNLSLFLWSTDACEGKVPLSHLSNHHQPLPHA